VPGIPDADGDPELSIRACSNPGTYFCRKRSSEVNCFPDVHFGPRQVVDIRPVDPLHGAAPQERFIVVDQATQLRPRMPPVVHHLPAARPVVGEVPRGHASANRRVQAGIARAVGGEAGPVQRLKRTSSVIAKSTP